LRIADLVEDAALLQQARMKTSQKLRGQVRCQRKAASMPMEVMATM
jgi:hypothetical protein